MENPSEDDISFCDEMKGPPLVDDALFEMWIVFFATLVSKMVIFIPFGARFIRDGFAFLHGQVTRWCFIVSQVGG